MSDNLRYRSGWVALSEEGLPCTFTSVEYRTLLAAETDRRETAALTYVTESWVEVGEWRRLGAPRVVDPWSAAIDWLLNQPLDEGDRIRFNCIADGLATREEVDQLSMDELVARQEAAEIVVVAPERGMEGKTK